MTMSSSLQDQISHGLLRLQTLRDEVKLHVHLAAMDVKDAWAQLEPQFAVVEHAAKEVSDVSHAAVQDLIKKAEALREKITKLERCLPPLCRVAGVEPFCSRVLCLFRSLALLALARNRLGPRRRPSNPCRLGKVCEAVTIPL